MSQGPTPGLALWCDGRGKIVEVLRNDLQLALAAPGYLFLRLADAASRSKAMDFLAGLSDTGLMTNNEWNVNHPTGPITLHFMGVMIGQQFLIVGAKNNKHAAHLYEDILRINNEQTNLLRSTLKNTVKQAEFESNLYDEISRLNNELVTMQRELAKQNAELERLNQEKNRFLGIAAHDLRSPLQAILMQSEFLLAQAGESLPLQHLEFLESIYTASQFVVNLVDDLLDVAKIEAGQLELNLEPVDLAALVARNVALNQLLASRKETEINLSLEPLPLAIVDPAKIEQILNNLISNAVKFSPPGSRVTVCLAQQGDYFRLGVQDRGPGLSPDMQQNLFQPFPRGRTPGTAQEKSVGLGLTIVKRIVDSHHGQVWLNTDPDAGTTFFVSIPFQPPEAAP